MMAQPRMIQLSRGRAPLVPPKQPLLNRDQVELLRLIAIGKHYTEIEQSLNVTKKTLRVRMHRILKILQIGTAAGAVAIALRKGILK